MPLLIKST